MSREYRNEIDEKNYGKINELVNGMPEFIEDYYDYLVSKGRTTNTIKSYMYEVNVFLRFVATVEKRKRDSVRIMRFISLYQNNHLYKDKILFA